MSARFALRFGLTLTGVHTDKLICNKISRFKDKAILRFYFSRLIIKEYGLSKVNGPFGKFMHFLERKRSLAEISRESGPYNLLSTTVKTRII